MSKNEKEVVNDLVVYLLCKLKSRNMPVNEHHVQLLVYKIKMELGKDHELFSKLPFYWGVDGPYCDLVSESLKDLNSKGMLEYVDAEG